MLDSAGGHRRLPHSRAGYAKGRGRAFANFIGAHRRFELTSVTDGVRCYTDYGHNPAEIKNALEIASLQAAQDALVRLAAAHLFAHERRCLTEFLETFDRAWIRVLITDICAARESDPGDISLRNADRAAAGAR